MSVPPDDAEAYSPAMRALTEKQRAFVIRYIENPLMSASTAARLAGYSDASGAAKVKAHGNLRSPRVIAAVNEELDKRFRFDAVLGRAVLVEIALDKDHPKRLQAAEALLSRGGFHVMHEQRIKVEHVDMSGEEMVRRIEQLALKLNMDPVQLLGNSSVPMKVVN